MAKQKAKTRTKDRDENQWYSLVEDMFESDKNWRAPLVEHSWYINRAYYSGMHNIKYDPRTSSLTLDRTDPMRFYINLIYPAIRAIRSVVTRTNPVWDVDAYPYGSMSQAQSDLLNLHMATLYEKLVMKEIVKEVLFYGLLCGIGVFQYGFDADADNGEGELWVKSLDPFDVYVGGRATTDIEDAERVTKVVLVSKKHMREMEKKGVYKNVKNIEVTAKTAESSYKELLQKMTQMNGSHGGQSNDDTLLLRETWYKEEGKVYVVTWSEGLIHRVEETEMDELPFILYKPDITPGVLYNEGWVKPLVPINKAINYLQRKILKYNVTFANGKYVTSPDSGVKTVTNESGEFITVNRGSEFTPITMPPLSSTPFNQSDYLMSQFQNISGVQEALLGRAPSGVTAAVALETLVSNSVGSMSDVIDNLGISLQKLGERLLTLAYENYSVTKPVRVKGADGTESIIKVGGKDASMSDKEIDGGRAVRLPERPQVRVKVAEGTAYTRQGRQDTLLNLRTIGDVDRTTLLEELGLEAAKIEARLLLEQQGMPTTVRAQEMIQNIQDEQVEATQPTEGDEGEQGREQEQAPQEQAPQGGTEAEAVVQEFIDTLAQSGVTVDPAILNDSNLLLAVISGSVPTVVSPDGVLVVDETGAEQPAF